MSNRISEAFAKGKAFIPFITCGDPSLEITEQLVYAMEEAGADLIELGIPFSDPTAEGPVIQEANVRALSGGVTTDKIFDMVVKIRKKTSIPMVFMTYANVVFSYGTERFIRKAAEIGMDGLILPDVPFEEKEEFDVVCKQYGLELISLIAPTSHDRITRIAKEANGFVYCVSSLGVTGTRTRITTDIGAMVKLVKAAKDIPCAVGFGISTPEQAKKMAAQSDGAIVGSAIVKICAAHGENCVPYVKEIFDMVVKIRKKTSIPMVFMTYANVVFSYGTERFIRKAAEIGMDGLILPDVPFEEKEEFDVVCKQYGLELISLIAPTSHDRITRIAKEANGFVYCVSSLGVTGTRTQITTDIGAMVKLVKAAKDIPCAVGFGISTPEQAKKMAAQSDGAIVGSAIVKICAAHGENCVPYVKDYVKSMKDAVREA